MPEIPSPVQRVHLVFMGVSGSGKTTIAELVRARTSFPFVESDKLHPPENIAKMSAGHPLNDDDRWPWLERIRDWLSNQENLGSSSIATCSALKRSYRDVLRAAAPAVVFVHVTDPYEVIAARLAARKGHFMPPGLLQSQLDTLEDLQPDEAAVEISNEDAPELVAARVLAILAERYPAVGFPHAEL
ncbi:gluconokinase [Gulosibacter macacae]|uniref:Gluconokinase n=1 Tax=Gulosibacter macacae TaxID=2488791 RepID=A0A3P3W1D8_9MICO|nr:gluconokinase [Gulosibacter macacae]RRJ88835.1 gluconokinase [Gulosibacter macacae]